MRALIPLLALTLLGAADGPGLIDAAKNADKAAVRALVQKKTDVNAAEADGTTALHWASYRDDLETVDLLIRAGAKVNAATDLGVTPLWNASQNGSAALRTPSTRQCQIRASVPCATTRSARSRTRSGCRKTAGLRPSGFRPRRLP